jgi:hypothetical protein
MIFPKAKVGEVWLVVRMVEMKWSAWSVLRQEWGSVHISICQQPLQMASISFTLTDADCVAIIAGFHVASCAFQHCLSRGPRLKPNKREWRPWRSACACASFLPRLADCG